jgi:3-hydroxybutyryl-CoA dehydrogenase
LAKKKYQSLIPTRKNVEGDMEIKAIGVLGAGSMGNGIAQVAAQAGYHVVMRDIEERFVQNGLKAIDKFLAKGIEKGKMTEDQKKGILNRIKEQPAWKI